MSSRFVGVSIVVFCAASQVLHAQTLLNFESLNDGAAVTTQFSGVTFSNAQTLTAGFSLDELEYPAHSGKNVITDNAGPITLSFSSVISAFSGYFTHSNPITVAAFDGGGNQIASTSSSKNNAAVSGDGTPPNELLSLNEASIAKVVITGAPAGNSVVADDLSYTIPSGPVVNSLVSSASFATGAVGSGSIATIFGTNLTTQTLTATTLPLPMSLGGVSVSIGGMGAALYYVSPTQVNIEMPADLPTGTATLMVNANGATTTLAVQIAAISPSIFLIGKYAAAINLPGGSINNASAGAAPMSYVEVFMTGGGPVSPAVPTGVAASASPLSMINMQTTPVTATVGGQMADVVFAGLTPGLVDLLQVNVQVPAGLADGDYPVVVSIGGVASNSGLLRITNP
jgi:uncharacterized protein (TIGR03437 family)